MLRAWGTILLCGALSGCSVIDAVSGDDDDDLSCPTDELCYRSPETYTPPLGVELITTGDFDSDGTIDLALTDNTGDIQLLHNDDPDAPGSLSTEDLPDDIEGTPGAIAAGDFDNNGTSEVVGIVGGTGLVQVRGATLAPFEVDLGAAHGLAVADFDGDLFDDVAVAANDAGMDQIVILFGKPGGGFDSAQTVLDTTEPVQDHVVGDFDDDGDLDIAIITQSPDSLLQVFENDGNAGFTPHTPFPPCMGSCPPAGEREDPLFLIASDFDNDGDDDLSVQITCGTACNTQYDAIHFLAADGIDSWGATRQWTFNMPSDQLRSADMDGDGSDDIVWQTRGDELGLLILPREYFVTSLAPVLFVNVNDVAIDTVLVDINDDGYADVATVTDFMRVDVILSQ